MLGILFTNQAFNAPSLNSPKKLSILDIYPNEQELPLPLKQSLDKTFVFRRAVKTPIGYEISPNHLSYSTITPWIKKIGELSGFKVATVPYNLRYNAGNELDKNGLFSIPCF